MAEVNNDEYLLRVLLDDLARIQDIYRPLLLDPVSRESDLVRTREHRADEINCAISAWTLGVEALGAPAEQVTREQAPERPSAEQVGFLRTISLGLQDDHASLHLKKSTWTVLYEWLRWSTREGE